MPNYIVFQDQPENLKVQIYGRDGSALRGIKVDSQGNLMASFTKTFTEETITILITPNVFTGSKAQNVSVQSVYSYFIKNDGTNAAEVKIQISPDDMNWVDDSGITTINSDELKVLVPSKFLKYVRVAFKSSTANQSTSLTIIFQAQS